MTDIEILRTALGWRDGGRRVALCTVAETWGSAPKPVGSHLVVDSEGAFLGSVSGGCVEADVVAEALDVIATGAARMLDFGVGDDLAWKAGLTCGGQIKVYVERLDDRLSDCLALIAGDKAAPEPMVLVTPLDGTPPRVVGHDEPLPHPIAAHIDEGRRTGRSKLVTQGGEQWLLTVFTPATRLVVFGAVHIAQAVATVARLADLDLIVVDPRSAFATPERFPGVRLVADWPNDAAPSLELGPGDAVAALSHDPKIDDQGLRLALEAGCFYVGALGSRRSHARRLERLRAAGVGEPDLQRIHAPIGLDIGAEGPAEIAISIVAEIIAARRGVQSAATASEAA